MENNYINDALLGKISREQNVRIGQIRAVLELIEGGATVPFLLVIVKKLQGIWMKNKFVQYIKNGIMGKN